MSEPTREERRHWLDDKKNVDKVVYTVYAVSAALCLLDLFYHKHTHEGLGKTVEGIEGWFGTYAFYGFVCCVGLVLTAKAMRLIVKRPEDYYDE